MLREYSIKRGILDIIDENDSKYLPISCKKKNDCKIHIFVMPIIIALNIPKMFATFKKCITFRYLNVNNEHVLLFKQVNCFI